MIRYAVFPGRVISKVDGDVHYISADMLMRLYRVNPKECIVIREDLEPHELRLKLKLVEEEKLICLEPRYSGDYTLPKE